MNRYILCLVALLLPQLTYANKQQQEESALEIGGRFMLDYERYNGLHNNGEQEEQLSVRRAQLSAKYQFSDNWKTKVIVAYDEDESSLELKEWKINYSMLDIANISLGRFKEPMGLEYATSSKDLLVMERSMMTNAFVAGRNLGVQINNKHKFKNGGMTWAFGFFDNSDDDSLSEQATTGRLTFYLKNKQQSLVSWLPKDSTLHVGASGSTRQQDPLDSIRINQDVELYSGDSIVESNRIDASEQSVLGVEAALAIGAFGLQAEYMQQQVTAHKNSNDKDSEYSGNYIQLSYQLTGERLRYDNHRFKGIKPNSDWGAVQLVAKFSQLDARDNGKGSEAENITLGLNYFYKKNLKVMLNLSEAKLSGKNSLLINEGESVSLRFQHLY